MNIATHKGHVECLRLLLVRKPPIDDCAVRYAAQNGDIDTLKLPLNAGAPIGRHAARAAARSGHFECLRLLLDRKAPIDKYAAEFTAQNGQVECLRLLLYRGGHIGNSAVRYAAENGHVECQKLIEASLAFERASKDGHIAAKKWYSKVFDILENKVEVDKRLMRKGKGVFHEPFERVAEYLGHAFNSAGMYGPHSKLDFMSRRAALQFYRNRVR